MAWLSVRYQAGGKFVAVRDKESVNQLRDAVKEVRHQGQKVDAADYEPTYGSSLFLVNWICPVQIKGHMVDIDEFEMHRKPHLSDWTQKESRAVAFFIF